jgi:hypothetical protein
VSPWTAGWLAWGVMFAVIEGAALVNNKGVKQDTLSQHVWWFRDNVKGGKVMLGLGLAWLSIHLMFG